MTKHKINLGILEIQSAEYSEDPIPVPYWLVGQMEAEPAETKVTLNFGVLTDANDLHSIASDSQDRHTNGNAYNAAIEAMNDYEQQLKKLNGVPK